MVYFIFNKPLFFFFWKIFISLTSTFIVFYFFLLQKDHYIFHDHIFNFCFFFFLILFTSFFWSLYLFFVFVDNILLTLLYIGNRTVYKKHYWSFMCFKKLTLPHKLCKFYKLCKLCESFMSSMLSSSHLKSHMLL